MGADKPAVTAEGPFEIERKFLIRFPELAWLQREAECSEIRQTYLLADKGVRARVRMRSFPDRCEYSYTEKVKLTPLRRIEREREISREEYEQLLRRADPRRRTIHKRRFCLPYAGKLLEIDLFDFWDDRAFLEIELEDEDEPYELPPQLQVLREVTGDKRYSNAALAREIPNEDIEGLLAGLAAERTDEK